MTDTIRQPRPCYSFDKYTLDCEARTLLRDRTVIQTTDKMILLLQALLEKPGYVAGKYDLLEMLWPNQEVSEWSLSRLVSDTRQALGEDARDQPLIQTVRGQGFRLNPEVEVSVVEAPGMFQSIDSQPGRYRAAAAITVLALVITGYWIAHNRFGRSELPSLGNERRLVVLPVVVSTGDDQDSWAEYGVMTMLAGQLERFPELQVADVESTVLALDQIQFDRSNREDLFREVCTPLGCRQLIATELALSEHGVPQLTYTLHTVDGHSPARNFENQDVLQASNAVFEDLLSTLLPPEPERVNVEGMYTEDGKANQNFALGASSVLRGDSQSATRYLSMALEQKPDYFWAKAYMADALTRIEDFEGAEKIINELSSLATDQRHQLHLAKLSSNVSYNRGNLKQAMVEVAEMLSLAIELNDKESEGHALMGMGTASQALGDNLQAIDYLTKALAVFREHEFELYEGKATFNLGNAHYVLNDYDQAEQYYVAAADMFRRQGSRELLSYARYALAAMRMTQGRLDLAESEFRELEQEYREIGEIEGLLLVRGELGTVELRRGNFQEAEALLLEAYDGAGDTYSYVRSWMSGLLAICYLNMGQPDMARPLVAERERFDWFEPRAPMVFIAASLAHADGDYAGAVNLAQLAQDRVGAQWTDRHTEWLQAFREAERNSRPAITDYYHLDSE